MKLVKIIEYLKFLLAKIKKNIAIKPDYNYIYLSCDGRNWDRLVANLFNRILYTGKIPDKWRKDTVVSYTILNVTFRIVQAFELSNL